MKLLPGLEKPYGSRNRLLATAALCAALGLGACGDMGRFQISSTPGLGPIKPNKPAAQTPATEREHERILSSYGGAYDDPKLQALISKTVDRLVAASERPDLAKHASIREDEARKASVVTRVVSEMGNDADMTALALAKTKLTMASFSRAQEFEADGIGVGISSRASFDPFGASRFLSAMERNAALKAPRNAADPRSLDFLSSHPATPERVQNAQANARQYASPEAVERDRDTYLSAIDNLVYGEDPSEGFVRGRRFLHPKLGFTFQAPDSFFLENTAQAVVGVKDGGSQAMRFDVVRVPSEQSLGDYLNSGWMDNVDKASTEDLTINGFPAATATAAGEQWQFRTYALRFGTDVYRFIFAAKKRTGESDKSFRDTVNSFRRLTLAEIQAARPLRIKVVTVQPGDTVESLSHRMQGVDRPLERFRILNGLDARASVKPRDRVKIVVD